MKKNVKRFVSMTMAMLVAAGSLAGCGGGGSASTGESAKAAANTGGSSGGAVTVKVSLSQAATEPPVKAAEYFKEIVEERSNGEIKVEIYPDNQLGNERDVIEGMQLGTVEMAMTSVAPFWRAASSLGSSMSTTMILRGLYRLTMRSMLLPRAPAPMIITVSWNSSWARLQACTAMVVGSIITASW